MTIKDQSATLELEILEVLGAGSPGEGDLLFRVTVDAGGFTGCNDSVWISRDNFDRFLDGLARLDERRNGVAEIESMSADEFRLCIGVLDSAGHILAHGKLSRVHPGPKNLLTNSIEFAIDVDPTLLRDVHRSFLRMVHP